MAKRFTDTEKWKKTWFQELNAVEKCFWIYLLDNCDHAGIWSVNFKLASFQIGEQLNETEIREKFQKQYMEVNDGKEWFIKDFIEFQYKCSVSDLSESSNMHKGIIAVLKKYGIFELLSYPKHTLSIPLKDSPDGLANPPGIGIGIGIGKEKGKGKEGENGKPGHPLDTFYQKFQIITKKLNQDDLEYTPNRAHNFKQAERTLSFEKVCLAVDNLMASPNAPPAHRDFDWLFNKFEYRERLDKYLKEKTPNGKTEYNWV